MNITWVYPFYLLLIPVLFALFLVRRSRQVRSQIARPKVKHLVASPSGVTKSTEVEDKPRRKGGWFGLIAVCLAATALARPQWGDIEQRTYERSREVIIALDLSRSMLATDVAPSRLERSKLLVDSLVNELQGERIGLVIFAGTSFVQYPLSNDYEVLREMLKEVNPSFLPQQGTDFGKLLQTAYKAYDLTSNADRFLIVLSDGEDLAGDWEGELKKFQEAKIHIISLGVGTAEGSVLPEEGGGLIKDEKGAAVLSRLDTKVLQKLADETGGRYVDAYRWVDLSKVISDTVNQGEKGEFSKTKQVLKAERFQIPLGLAVFFALLSLWRDFPVFPKHSLKKPSNLDKAIDKHTRKKTASPLPTAATLLLLMVLPLAAQQPLPNEMSQRGQQAPGQQKPEARLASTVQSLSSMDLLSPKDYATLAGETISYGKTTQQSKGEISMGAIDDALMGVDEGEAMDSKAADWPTLRKELEELKKKANDQQKQKQDQQKQDQKNKDKNKDQKQDQQQSSGGSDNNKDKNNQQNQQDQNSQQNQQNQNSGQNQNQNGKSGNQQNNSQNQDQNQQNQQNQGSKDQQQGQNGQDPQKKDQQNQGKNGNEPKDKDEAQQNPQQGPGSQGDKEKKDEAQQSQGGGGNEKKDQPQPTKSVGGGSGEQGNEQKEQIVLSPEMARKLEEIKEKDSPGKVYQLFGPKEPPKDSKGKTW